MRVKRQNNYSQLNIVVIGCGNWGKNHIRVLKKIGALYAISDLDLGLSAKLSEEFEVPQYTFEKIIQDKKIDGVIIVTPVATHHQIATACLNANLHVFVEKPLAIDMQEAQDIHELAKQVGKTLMVGHLLHYHAAFNKLKSLRLDGTLGQLQYIYANRLNLGKFRTEEDIWWSYAPHDVSMILSLIDEMPISVKACGAKYLEHTIKDVTWTHLTFPKGEQAQIFVSWLHPYKEQKLIVVGEKAMAIFDDGQPWASKLTLYPYPNDWVDGLPQPQPSQAETIAIPHSEPLMDESLHFLDCILENGQVLTGGDESLKVLAVLNAADKSIQLNKTIFLNPLSSQNNTTAQSSFEAHETARVDDGCHIGAASKLWQYSHILSGSYLGEQCTIGQNTYIGPNVSIGHHCQIQSNVHIHDGITIEDEVCIGPNSVFSKALSHAPTLIKRGTTIGANAKITCGVTLGQYCFLAAGAVVTTDVLPHALMSGSPAQQIGWVSHDREPLNDVLYCSHSKRQYKVRDNKLTLEEACLV